MNLKTVLRFASAAVVVGLAVMALVACGAASSGDIPTAVVSSSSESGTFSASDLSAAGDTSGTETSGDGGGQGPPEALLAACEGLSAEASCSFTSPLDGSIVDGSCRASRHDPGQYVCLPADWDGFGRGHRGPSEEALAACEGIATGTACSFEADFGTVEGTCNEGPGDSGQVACRPDWVEGGGPGDRGDRHEAARAACENLQTDAACSFEGPFGNVEGSCRTGRDGSTLVCAPADWPGQ